MAKVRPKDWAGIKAALVAGTTVARPYEAKITATNFTGCEWSRPAQGEDRSGTMANDTNTKRMPMTDTKGSLDWANPSFILATAAAAIYIEISTKSEINLFL